MSQTPIELASAFAKALGDGRCALIGAVARNAYTTPRATADVDFAVFADRDALHVALSFLKPRGFDIVREQRADVGDELPDIVIFRSAAKVFNQVDLLVAKTPFEDQVLARARVVNVEGHRVPVARPEDLIVYKLIADRPRDRDDIVALVQTLARTQESLDWEHIRRWAKFWGIEDRLEQIEAL